MARDQTGNPDLGGGGLLRGRAAGRAGRWRQSDPIDLGRFRDSDTRRGAIQ